MGDSNGKRAEKDDYNVVPWPPKHLTPDAILSEIDVTFRDPVFLYEDDAFRWKNGFVGSERAAETGTKRTKDHVNIDRTTESKGRVYDMAANIYQKYRKLGETQQHLEESLKEVVRLESVMADRLKDVKTVIQENGL